MDGHSGPASKVEGRCLVSNRAFIGVIIIIILL